MANFAGRLKQLRQEHGMNQQELADRLGISRSAVGMYEQGRRDPDFELLDAIADLFGVDLSYMLGSSDVRGSYPRHGTLAAPDPEEAAILEAYRKAPEDVRRLVLYALRLKP